MLDPITATFAAGMGARFVDKVSNFATGAADQISKLATGTAVQKTSKATAATDSFETTFTDLATNAFNRLFAAHPEIKAKLAALGDGPYNLTQLTDGSLQISSQTTGGSMTLDPNSGVGQQAKFLANSLELKNFENGLEISPV